MWMLHNREKKIILSQTSTMKVFFLIHRVMFWHAHKQLQARLGFLCRLLFFSISFSGKWKLKVNTARVNERPSVVLHQLNHSPYQSRTTRTEVANIGGDGTSSPRWKRSWAVATLTVMVTPSLLWITFMEGKHILLQRTDLHFSCVNVAGMMSSIIHWISTVFSSRFWFHARSHKKGYLFCHQNFFTQ